ncbi:endospore germination permease [Herbivorax sp. ANBcel31]|uniref:GerAB/ArcD/ProY family transporter n=1 Tax=Herbivorax sp. ANBcel31 TaxID=3069754 RepID=UPI0027B1676C|nr:endospore germination permease [Herbivorax sp. ANBcel31]MDQ2085570.1 endospore germination permease [Herbivorax sp. ANBcel31]
MSKNSIKSVGIEKISSLQLLFLLVTAVIATADVFLPAYVAQQAGRDSWISVIIATISSLIIVNIFISLGLRYPNKTFVEYSCDILGKPLGKLAGIIFLYYTFLIASISTKNLGEIFIIAFNPEIPIILFIVLTILLTAYTIGQGIEVIARINEVLFPIAIIILIGIGILNLDHLNFNYFLPVLYDGILPPLRGGLLIQSWLVETVIVLQLIPFIKDKKNIRSKVTASIVILGFGLQIGVLTIALFGAATKIFMLPALEFVRFASFGENLRGVDITIMGIWMGGIVVKISIFFYVFTTGLAQLLNIKSYKGLILPSGTLLITFSMAFSRNVMEGNYFANFIKPFYSFSVAFILPTLVLLVSKIRKNN